ncbi:MAG TPA: DUF4126 domain-containing protein [Anaerolineae bacterium]|nr:DUF4126 domain-containing protein [Anaerolineae bacterium]
MDVISAFNGISAAFGLSSSAGLNAYIPLLLVALAARFPLHDPLVNLAEPYNLISNPWVIGLLTILLFIEMLVDKVPAADTVNDVIHTFIRPAAGAFLFAANANIITDIHPLIAAGAGLLVAGSVHTTKGLVRPAVTATTAGTGNWLVSLIEDIFAIFLSILAIFIPILGVIFGIIFIIAIWRLYRRRQNRKATSFA